MYLGAVFQLSTALRDIAKEGADTLDIWRMGRDFFLFMNAEKDIRLPSNGESLGTQDRWQSNSKMSPSAILSEKRLPAPGKMKLM
ncbi:hypothetical protein RSC3_04211 [Bacillus paralicheniformis]|nr:hypothetical protein RSC3_04211 [Bacillus paralicheniformis]